MRIISAGAICALFLSIPSIAEARATADLFEPVRQAAARICAPSGPHACRPLRVMSGADFEEQYGCLAEAIFYEAGGEPLRGRIAVVDVIVKRRARLWRGARTICDVVRDKKEICKQRTAGLTECRTVWQFVGMQYEGRRKSETRDWIEARRLARFVLTVHWQETIDADHFWADCGRVPDWVDRSKMSPVDCIGEHYFWKHR